MKDLIVKTPDMKNGSIAILVIQQGEVQNFAINAEITAFFYDQPTKKQFDERMATIIGNLEFAGEVRE